MKINIAICDDENIALRINYTYIEELVKKYRINANVIGFLRGEKLVEYMEKNTIDIAFLDIDLKSMNGIAIASRLLRKNPKVITIFISGHREYAFDAFAVEAFGYLPKPIDSERLERLFKKAIIQVNYISRRAQASPLIITVNNIKKKINQSSILYIERKKTQSIIITKTGWHYVYETITSLASRLERNFVQINQGVIVNMDELASIEGNRAIMKKGEVFTVGRTYSKNAKKNYLEYPGLS